LLESCLALYKNEDDIHFFSYSGLSVVLGE
jgi:hypothetical protein